MLQHQCYATASDSHCHMVGMQTELSRKISAVFVEGCKHAYSWTFNLRERGKFGALSHPQEAGHQDSSHNTHMHSLNKHALTVTDVNHADHKHALNGKKGGCMLFLETDPGWSLETQMLLITTCHNSDFGFKSCVSLHLSPWSRVIASSRLQSAASTLSWLRHPGVQGVHLFYLWLSC